MPDVETPVTVCGLKAKLDLINGLWLSSSLGSVEGLFANLRFEYI